MVVGATAIDVVVVVAAGAAPAVVSPSSTDVSRAGVVVVTPPEPAVGATEFEGAPGFGGATVFDGATDVTGEFAGGAVVVVACAPDDGAFVVVVTDTTDVVVEDGEVVVVVVVAAGIDTATDAGDPDKMFVWLADPEYDTENDEASASELVPVAPSAEIVDTAEIVQTVDDVWLTVMDTMFVRSKSTPSTAETVAQSIWPDVAVSRN